MNIEFLEECAIRNSKIAHFMNLQGASFDMGKEAQGIAFEGRDVYAFDKRRFR